MLVFQTIPQTSYQLVGKLELETSLEKQIGAEVLRGSCDDAARILSDAGAKVSGESLVSLESVARFYGVEPSYVKSVCARVGISSRRTPYDVSLEGREVRYSPRVVLLLSCLMCFGKTIPAHSKAREVYRLIKNTDYAHDAEKRLNDILKSTPPKVRKSKATASIQAFIQNHQVKPTTQPAKPQSTKAVVQTPCKLTRAVRRWNNKPEGWDQIVSLYRDGKITASDVTRIFDMPTSTFYYLLGKFSEEKRNKSTSY